MTGVSTADTPSLPSQIGEPAWELAEWYPRQGAWSVDDYLQLDGNRLVEFDGGLLEFLPMPSAGHQMILGFLYQLLSSWTVARQRPAPLLAPIPVEIRSDKFREPDLLLPSRPPSPGDRRIGAVDLALEIVGPDPKSRRRDYVIKRGEYARAAIPEYWIVDPESETITVLTLVEGATEYEVSGEYKPGQTAASVLLPEFTVDVSACFAAGKVEP